MSESPPPIWADYNMADAQDAAGLLGVSVAKVYELTRAVVLSGKKVRSVKSNRMRTMYRLTDLATAEEMVKQRRTTEPDTGEGELAEVIELPVPPPPPDPERRPQKRRVCSTARRSSCSPGSYALRSRRSTQRPAPLTSC